MQDRYMKQSVDSARCIQRQYRSVGRPDKGVHQAGFLVLRNTSMPSVLTELGSFPLPPRSVTSTPQPDSRNSAQHLQRLPCLPSPARPAQARFARRPSAQTARSRAKPKRKQSRTEKSRDDKESIPSNATRSSVKTETESRDAAVVPVNVVPTSQLNRHLSAMTKSRATKRPPSNTRKPRSLPTQRHAATHVAKPLRTKSAPRAITQANCRESRTYNQGKASHARQCRNLLHSTGSRTREISPRDPQFKGLTVKRVKEGNLYKYYHGSFTNYAEAHRAMPGVLKSPMPIW